MWAKNCGRDLTTVVIHFNSKENIKRKVAVRSAYFPSDAKEAPPPQEVKDLIRDFQAEGLDLVIGCDANSHNTVWGSSDCNNRRESARVPRYDIIRHSECGLQADVIKFSTRRGSRHLVGFGRCGEQDRILECLG